MENLVQNCENNEKQKKKYGLTGFVFDIVSIFVTALVFISILFTFVIRFVGVNGDSMEPTLQHNDWLVISAFNPEIKHGDIIISTQPNAFNEPLVKRVIATGGQTVDIDFVKGEVYVDGQLLDEPYIAEPTHTTEGVSFPIIVPEGQLFVMGDNRNESSDSRSPMVGCIDERYVLGVVRYRIAPEFTKIG